MTRVIKQVLVVRKDLHMRKGKIAAQCCHASMKVLLDRMPPATTVTSILPWKTEDCRSLKLEKGSPLQLWLDGSFAKICVYVKSEAELDEIYNKAQEAGVMTAMIVDSGRTEFHGNPTKTVVAVGPAWTEQIDPITGHLPLL